MIFAGGRSIEVLDKVGIKTIEYITIISDSNGSYFGDMTEGKAPSFGVSGTQTTAYICGGTIKAVGNGTLVSTRVIETIRFATLSNGSNFGNIVDSGQTNYLSGVHSNQSRAIIALFTRNDYIIWNTQTISSNFGTKTSAQPNGTAGDSVRVLVPVSFISVKENSKVVEYVPNIYSQSSASTFGNIYLEMGGMASASNGTYVLYTGGMSLALGGTNLTGFFTIATTGNSVDFGNLSYNLGFHAGSGNQVLAVFGGGNGPNSDQARRTIFKASYTTKASYSNFGELTTSPRVEVGATTGNHGGLY